LPEGEAAWFAGIRRLPVAAVVVLMKVLLCIFEVFNQGETTFFQ
jgi:hypothetical protein